MDSTDMGILICIPTCKPDVSEQIAAIKSTTRGIPSVKVYSTNKMVSAAKNRNACISKALETQGVSHIVMLDDDISGYSQGWLYEMLAPLHETNDVVMVSARLIHADGRYAPQMGAYNTTVFENEAPYFSARDFKGRNVVCSAAIAWRLNDLAPMKFDEGYNGSGYEDTDFCFQIRQRFTEKHIVITNRCKLVHRNEAKHQGGVIGIENRAYFLRKWNIES